MTKKQKVKLLQDIESGKIKIEDLRPKTVVILYDQEGNYYLKRGLNVMTKEAAEAFSKNFEHVFYIPDNFRD